MPTTGEIEHGLLILVLHAWQWIAIDVRDIVVHLSCRVRVERDTDTIDGPFDGARIRILLHETGNLLIMLRKQHLSSRKCQGEYGIIWHIVPVDQVIQHKIVHLERQDMPHDFDILLQLLVQSLQLRNLAEIRY